MKQKNIYHSCFAVIIMTLLFFLGAVLEACIRLYEADMQTLQFNRGNIYIQLQQISSPFANGIEQYEQLEQKLEQGTTFTYYEIYKQPLESIIGKSAFCKEMENSEEQWINSVQVGENLMEDFPVEIIEGRKFTSKDYIYSDGEYIPVILGYDYGKACQIGEEFTANYLYDMYRFRVIGIMEKGCHLEISLKNINLDDCIIMPSFKVTKNVPETDGLKIHYANKTSGILKLKPTELENTEKDLEIILKESGAGEYEWYTSLEDVTLRKQFGIGIVELAIFSFGSVILLSICYMKVKRGKRTVENVISLGLSFCGYKILAYAVSAVSGFKLGGRWAESIIILLIIFCSWIKKRNMKINAIKILEEPREDV